MRPLREIWADIVQSWKDAFPPADANLADVANLTASQYYKGMHELSAEEQTDVWKQTAGIETSEAKAERLATWVSSTRAALAADSVPEQTLAIFDALTDAKWPTNAMAAIAFWVVYTGGKLAGVGKIVGAEAMYALAREMTPARPDPSTAWRMFFTSDIGRVKIEDSLRDAGWDEEYIDALEAAHKQYTDAGDALELYRRGELDQQGFYQRLQKSGYADDAILDVEKLKDLIPAPPDLVRMALREAFRDDVAAAWSYDEDFPAPFADWMEKQGFTREWSKFYWRAHWALPSVQQGFEMRHRDVIDDSQLDQLLRISDIPRKWRENLTEIAYRPLTRVDVRRMHDMSVLDEEQVKRAYKDLGYNEQNAALMMDFTVAYNARTGASELKEYKDLTRSVILSAYKKSIISKDQAETRLMDIGYESEGIDILLSLSEWQQDIDEAPDYLREYQRDIRGIVEKAYAERVLSNADAMDTLVGVGYAQAEAVYLLTAVDFWWGMEQSAETLKTVGEAYVKRGINRADALDALGQFGISSDMMQMKMGEWDIQRNIRSRRLTESQYRRALENELITVPEYAENLRGLGYTDYDIWILVAMAAGSEAAGQPPEAGPLSLIERGV